MRPRNLPPVALTVAGSDSGGGAGIQADLKTFTVLGCYGMSAITAVTSQNTVCVSRALILPPDLVVSQMEDVVTDIGCQAAKTGMLGAPELVEAVAEAIEALSVAPLVVDPVMVAKSGDVLLQDAAVAALVEHLLPLATVATPNLPEAERLLGRSIKTEDEMVDAARDLGQLGCQAVVVKGGHRADAPVDVLWLADGDCVELIEGPRLPSRNTHGTGCVFSAAITAYLAHGVPVPPAVHSAKHFVTEAIRHGLPLGRGHGPVNVLGAGPSLPQEQQAKTEDEKPRGEGFR